MPPTPTAISTPNTPKSTACRSPSSRAAGRPPIPSPARCPPASAPSKAASPARSRFPACSATATTWPTIGSPPPSRTTRRLALSTADIPTKIENAPIVGESSIHTLDDLKRRRPNEVAFLLAKLTLEKYFRDDDGNDKPWLFPQLLGIAKRWLAECVTLKDNTFPQLLLLIEFAHDAADRIYKSIVASTDGTAVLKPILRPTTPSAPRATSISTRPGPSIATRADKCHISHVVADTDSWEQKMAEALEDMPEVVRYVKNHNLGFTIPYTLNGEEKNYIPDFIACIDDGHGPDDLLNLIVEVTGEKKKDKAAKVATARTLWVPAINNHGGFGRWAFIEVADPWDSQHLIRGAAPFVARFGHSRRSLIYGSSEAHGQEKRQRDSGRFHPPQG